MYGLPESTTVNRKIPKKRFYENINISPALKRSFVEEIQAIYWSNKIATYLVNIHEGCEVNEMEVFTIELNKQLLNEAVLRQIDREIPYHILFILKFEGKCQAWIAFKEASGNNQIAFKVDSYYHTEWLLEQNLVLKVDGLNTDEVYENFVRQIAGDALKGESAESLKESVERNNRREELEKKIEKTEAAAWKETQPKKRFDLYSKLQKYKNELEELKHGET